MVVELRHGVSSSQGPRSYQEDLTIVVPDLRASLKSRPADEPSTTKHADDASRGDVVDLSNLPSPSAYYGVSGVVTDRFPRAWHCAPGTGARSLLLFRPLRKNRVPHATTFFWLLPFASFVSSSYPNPVLPPLPSLVRSGFRRARRHLRRDLREEPASRQHLVTRTLSRDAHRGHARGLSRYGRGVRGGVHLPPRGVLRDDGVGHARLGREDSGASESKERERERERERDPHFFSLGGAVLTHSPLPPFPRSRTSETAGLSSAGRARPLRCRRTRNHTCSASGREYRRRGVTSTRRVF